MTYTKADIRRMSCDNCGEPPWFTDPYRRIEVDHIDPHGPDTEDNWQPLCGRCNRHKSAMTNTQVRVATTMPDASGRQMPWPRGFNWTTKTWNDGSAVDWVHGQLFTYPVRVAIPSLQQTETI